MSATSRVTGTVDRSRSDWQTSAHRLVRLAPELAETLGASPSDVVEIATEYGRRTLGRIGETNGPTSRPDAVFLDRFTRETLKARMNDRVELELRADLPTVGEVTLGAPMDLARAHNLTDHLQSVMAASQTPCIPGARIYLPLPHSAAGMVYEVTEVLDEPGIFGAESVLRVEPPGVRREEGTFDVTFEDVGGVRNQITLLRELVQLPLRMPFVYRQLGISAPRGVILYGPPGSGKTHLARAVTNEINARFYVINGPDVVGTMQGETESNIRRIFNEAAHHAPSVILLDELDAIAPHRGQTGSHSDTRAATTLLSLMDGLQRVDGVVLIGTTNRVDAVDGAFRRPGRFDREVFVGPPDVAGRLEILEIHTREMPLTDNGLTHLSHVAKASHGYVGADLMELCREAGLSALRRSRDALADHLSAFGISEDGVALDVEPGDFDEALRRLHPSALRESVVVVPEVSWDDVGGLEHVKRHMRNLVERPLVDPEAYRKANLRPPTGVLLHGAPGTGKTMLVHALANSAKVNFLAVDGPTIFSKWLGDSEQAIRHVFTVARQLAPAIVFFDQVDAVVPRRGGETETRTTERVVDQMLSEFDALQEVSEVIVIGATNHLELIDPAVLRPGRFGLQIHVPMPDRDDRQAVARTLLREVQLADDLSVDDAAGLLADASEHSGAEVKHIIDDARLRALEAAEFEPPAVVRLGHLSAAIKASLDARHGYANHGIDPTTRV
ncbi:MAG: AAA family ATPase [Actinobacteria bacterium]|nr:AAA family ATPase [Actinomycetota bacterium]